MLVTDLNSRERERYASRAITTAEAFTDMAAALRSGDDQAALIAAIRAGMAGGFMDELTEIFVAATHAEVPDYPQR